MRLGYACTNVTIDTHVREMRLATLRERGLDHVQTLFDENLRSLAEILRWNRLHRIEMFRYPANLVPLGSHAEVDHGALDYSAAAGIALLADGMRLSVHPGHFTVVSASGPVWQTSAHELAYQTDLMDRLGLEGDIIVHGGGVYGDRIATARRIVFNILSLPPALRKRLRLENDERAWPVHDLLPVCEETGVPLVVDNLHHALNGDVPLAALPWARIQATWCGRVPKLHYSEQDPAKKPGAHSAYVDTDAFRHFQAAVAMDEFDVMLECKAKELALLRLRAALDGDGGAGVGDAACMA